MVASILKIQNFKDSCKEAVVRITSCLGAELPDPVFAIIGDEAAMGLYTASLVQGGEITAWHQADFLLIRRSLQGLIVEEYQKSKRMLVAECRRA